jgi:hypothetical protein
MKSVFGKNCFWYFSKFLIVGAQEERRIRRRRGFRSIGFIRFV